MGGVVAVLGDRDQDGRPVQAMLEAASHRGPATAVQTIGRSAIGIQAHSDRSDSWIERTDGMLVGFTGRLDNADELTKELERAGTELVSTTPAGLVLALFGRHDVETPVKLRGAFSCVVTDGHRLWFFRDHLGFETLFWRRDAGGIYVASEAKQVVVGAGIPFEPDVEVLESIYYSDIEDHTMCALKGVRRVLAGTILVAEMGHARVKRFWRPDGLLESAKGSFDEIQERFDELMERACARVLTGEDAISLSGGIDSPAVAAYAAKAHLEITGRPLQALSAVYPDFPASDESDYIEEVARYLDLPLHTYEPQPQRLDRLQDWVRLFDGPWSIWSPLGAEEQFRIATGLGVQTILTGEMAEQVMAMQLGLVPYLLSRGRVAAALHHLRLQRAKGAAWRGLARQVGGTVVPKWAVTRYIRRRPLLEIPDWLDPDRAGRGRSRHALAGRRYWSAAQLGAFGEGSSLTLEASSILQARDGVRIRQPWADVDLWEFFLSIPAERKFPDPQVKALVRKLLRGKVPDSIVDRTDKPVLNEWFETTSQDYASLRQWLSAPKHRVLGIDYDRLAQRLEREDMNLAGYIWAKDLAAMQAFLSLW